MRPAAPLKLLNPSNHGHAQWVYQSSYGGGFVGRDLVRLHGEVSAKASLFLSSQASTKAYRGSNAHSELELRVGSGALAISWPDPVACFAGATLSQTQRFFLDAADAGVLAVDVLSAGRLARNERWDFEHYASKVHVDLAERPLVRESLVLSQKMGPLRSRLKDVEALATVVVAGERCACLADAAEQWVHAQSFATGLTWSLSRTPHRTVLRGSSTSLNALVRSLREGLQRPVAAMLGDDPWSRKW